MSWRVDGSTKRFAATELEFRVSGDFKVRHGWNIVVGDRHAKNLRLLRIGIVQEAVIETDGDLRSREGAHDAGDSANVCSRGLARRHSSSKLKPTIKVPMRGQDKLDLHFLRLDFLDNSFGVTTRVNEDALHGRFVPNEDAVTLQLADGKCVVFEVRHPRLRADSRRVATVFGNYDLEDQSPFNRAANRRSETKMVDTTVQIRLEPR